MSEFEDYQPEAQTGGAWMLTFADLLSLILAFFVLLFATTSVKKPEFERIVKSLSQRLNPEAIQEKAEPDAEISIEKEQVSYAKDIGYLNQIFTEKMDAAGLKDKLLVQNLEDRLVLSITGEQSFMAGSIKMTPELELLLAQLSGVLRGVGNRIEIHGNADPSPPSGKEFPSNWELSLARALAVGDMLREHGYSHPFSVYGRGDSAYADLPRNLTPQEKLILSRRIDIIIRADSAN